MKARHETKVGLFVLIGLVLLALLMMEFSKGTSLFRSSYTIYLSSTDVGGLKPKAAVLMSGVQIGTVRDIQLDRDGKTVTISLKVYSDFRIHKDARFVLEQSGFLGDQYVAVQPTENKDGVFEDGGRAKTETPFNLQQAARSASGLIQRLDTTALRLNEAISDVHNLLLNQETLTNLASTIANLRLVSERALEAVARVDAVVASNTPSIAQSGSNLVTFSEQLTNAGAELNGIISRNSPELSGAVSNLQSSSIELRKLLADVQAGKGPAGKLLKDEKMAQDLAEVAENLSITTSNLNRLGLWGILWKRKPPKEETAAEHKPAARLQSPKSGSR